MARCVNHVFQKEAGCAGQILYVFPGFSGSFKDCLVCLKIQQEPKWGRTLEHHISVNCFSWSGRRASPDPRPDPYRWPHKTPGQTTARTYRGTNTLAQLQCWIKFKPRMAEKNTSHCERPCNNCTALSFEKSNQPNQTWPIVLCDWKQNLCVCHGHLPAVKLLTDTGPLWCHWRTWLWANLVCSQIPVRPRPSARPPLAATHKHEQGKWNRKVGGRLKRAKQHSDMSDVLPGCKPVEFQ